MRSGPPENLVPVQRLRRGPLRIDSGGAKLLLLSRVGLWSFHRPRLRLRRFYHPCKPIRKHFFHLSPPFSTESSLFRSWTTLPNLVVFSPARSFHADSRETFPNTLAGDDVHQCLHLLWRGFPTKLFDQVRAKLQLLHDALDTQSLDGQRSRGASALSCGTVTNRGDSIGSRWNKPTA